jgi:hypothetical protein
MRGLRGIGIAVGVVFVVAALLRLVDQLNLVTKRPVLPASANLVDKVLGSITYRHDVWPVFFGSNILIAIGFAGIAAVGWLLATRMQLADDRRALVLGTFVTGGILGAVGQLLLVGAVKATIDLPYCDCGFKEQEVVSQVWALMVAQSAADWLVNGALLLAAGGLVVAAGRFGGREMPESWSWLSLAIAVLLLAQLVLAFVDAGDLGEWLLLLTVGVLVPVWSIWLGLRFTGRDQDGVGQRS